MEFPKISRRIRRVIGEYSYKWPQTVEGRALCVFLALYAFAVFGYVTATLATFFIGRDAEHDEAELAGTKQLAALRDEMTALREEIRTLLGRPPPVGEKDESVNTPGSRKN